MMMNDEVVKTQETAATEVVAEVNPAPQRKEPADSTAREERAAATVMTDVPAAKDLSTKTRDTTRTTVSSKRPFP